MTSALDTLTHEAKDLVERIGAHAKDIAAEHSMRLDALRVELQNQKDAYDVVCEGAGKLQSQLNTAVAWIAGERHDITLDEIARQFPNAAMPERR